MEWLLVIASMSKNFFVFFFIQRWDRGNDREFFLQAKFAHFLTWCEGLRVFDDLPFDVEVDVFVF